MTVVLIGGGCAAPTAAPPTTHRHQPDPTTSTTPPTSSSLVPSATPTSVPAPVQPPPGWTAALTTLPPGGGFTSLSCISDTFCVAAGGGADGQGTASTTGAGVTVSWDGASWSQPSVYFPAPASGAVTAPLLPSIACTSGPSCTIVDGSGHLSTGDGTNWSAPGALAAVAGPPANPADPGPGHPGSRSASIACPVPSFCAVVDNTGHTSVLRNGASSAAQSFTVPGAAVAPYQAGRVGIACPTRSSCTAVVGTTALDWDGTSWSEEPTPWTATAVPGPTAVACPSARLCAILAGAGLWVRNGQQGWTSEGAVDPGSELDAIACPTASFCMAADTAGKVLSWNGSGWSAPRQVLPQAVQYPGAGTSIACPTAAFCMVMNGDGDYATYTAAMG